MPYSDPVTDYYRQSQPVDQAWQGPQIDPELLQSAAALQQQAFPTMVLSSRGQPAAPVANNAALFPETAWTSKKTESDAFRAQAKVLKAAELTKFAGLPEHVYKAYDNYYTSLMDQQSPELPDFVKANPQVEGLGKNVADLVKKRNAHLSDLATYVNQSDKNTSQLPGESEKEWIDRVVPMLAAQLKIYNTALVGTSDALSNQERKDLAPQLPVDRFSMERFKKTGSGSLLKGEIGNFKNQVAELHDMILNEINDGYNIVAVQSSPSYANKQLGTLQFYPLIEDPTGNRRRIPRITEDAPPEAIQGLKPLAQALYARQEAFNADKDAAHNAIKEGRSRKQVEELFLKQHGTPLPPK